MYFHFINVSRSNIKWQICMEYFVISAKFVPLKYYTAMRHEVVP